MSNYIPRGVIPRATNYHNINSASFSPVRKIVRRSPKRTVGRFPSTKCGRTISWESQIERDFLYLLEIDKAVMDFVEQPERLKIVIDGNPRSYVPDFWVNGHDGRSWVVEIKPDEKAQLPENQARFAAAAEACLQRNVGFRVVLESSIRREPRLSNARFLYRYNRIYPPVSVTSRVLATLEGGASSLGVLREQFDFRHIMALLLQGVVETDLDQPLTNKSVLWFPQEGGAE